MHWWTASPAWSHGERVTGHVVRRTRRSKRRSVETVATRGHGLPTSEPRMEEFHEDLGGFCFFMPFHGCSLTLFDLEQMLH